jgi:hypothetical protein
MQMARSGTQTEDVGGFRLEVAFAYLSSLDRHGIRARLNFCIRPFHDWALCTGELPRREEKTKDLDLLYD